MFKDATTAELEKELNVRKALQKLKSKKVLPMAAEWPSSPVGRWKVTTEGDVEGRTTKQLGTYTGHVADIAFRLGNKGGYTLRFHVAPKLPKLPIKVNKEVNISLGMASGTNGMTKESRSDTIQQWLQSKPTRDLVAGVETDTCPYYSGVTLRIY